MEKAFGARNVTRRGVRLTTRHPCTGEIQTGQTKGVLPLCSRQIVRFVQKIVTTIPGRRPMPFFRHNSGPVIGNHPADPDGKHFCHAPAVSFRI
jgi:hypothetical protein